MGKVVTLDANNALVTTDPSNTIAGDLDVAGAITEGGLPVGSIDAGTATTVAGGGNYTLIDNTKAWSVNAFQLNSMVTYLSGGAKASADIASNTATQLVLAAGAPIPDATTTYAIYGVGGMSKAVYDPANKNTQVATTDVNNELVENLSGAAAAVALGRKGARKRADGTWDGTSILLTAGYDLHLWADDLVSGQTYLVLDPLNAPALGWWYVQPVRNTNDSIGAQWRTLRVTAVAGTGFNNGTVFTSTNSNGVWSAWERVLTDRYRNSYLNTIASAATLDLSFATGAKANMIAQITGTANITAVTMDQASKVEAIANGVFTITSGTYLVLQGMTTYTAAIGDRLTFISFNGVKVYVYVHLASGLKNDGLFVYPGVDQSVVNPNVWETVTSLAPPGIVTVPSWATVSTNSITVSEAGTYLIEFTTKWQANGVSNPYVAIAIATTVTSTISATNTYINGALAGSLHVGAPVQLPANTAIYAYIKSTSTLPKIVAGVYSTFSVTRIK